MQAYVHAANQRHAFRNKARQAADPTRVQRHTIKQADVTLRMQRRTVREQRQVEDHVWQHVVHTWRALRAAYWGATPREYAAYRAAEQQWHRVRVKRQQALARRKVEDATWRAERLAIRTALAEHAPPTAWYAILIVVDNCTRQCYGLPVLRSGAHVTSEQVRQALQQCLPRATEFVISDRGTHFTAQGFQALVQEQGFTHVVTSRRRPQTNGIAERMVRTLKAWLREHPWDSADALEGLVDEFRQDYNDRPHQGKELAGRSPNAYMTHIQGNPFDCAKGD